MSSPARCGHRRLTMLGNSTFITAIALPASTVPGNSSVPGNAPRSSRPVDNTASATNRTRSSPAFLLSQAPAPETIPKHSTGMDASAAMANDDRPSSCCNSGKTGETLVIAPRRLNPIAVIETTSSTAAADRLAGLRTAGNNLAIAN